MQRENFTISSNTRVVFDAAKNQVEQVVFSYFMTKMESILALIVSMLTYHQTHRTDLQSLKMINRVHVSGKCFFRCSFNLCVLPELLDTPTCAGLTELFQLNRGKKSLFS